MPSSLLPSITSFLGQPLDSQLIKLCTRPVSCTHFSPLKRNYSQRQRLSLPADQFLGSYDTREHGAIGTLSRWWRRLRPFKVELRELRRRLIRNRWGFDHAIGNLTRYFVRFPFLTDEEFSTWRVTCDRDMGLGYSWAEFVRSGRSAPGHAIPPDASSYFSPTEASAELSAAQEGDHSHPFAYTQPAVHATLGPNPGSKVASSDALVASVSDEKFKGFGVFRGFISTRVPDRGDLAQAGFANLSSPESTLFGFLLPYAFFSHTHLVIRYRGDGRTYRINLACEQYWDVCWHDVHHFVLCTRGGPYWQIAKIPLSKFFILRKGLIRKSQRPLQKNRIRLVSFTLMDSIDGPFCLELDYISLFCDRDHQEQFAYEQYDRSGILQ